MLRHLLAMLGLWPISTRGGGPPVIPLGHGFCADTTLVEPTLLDTTLVEPTVLDTVLVEPTLLDTTMIGSDC